MQKTDILIVGGSASGITAAITARRHYPDAEITLIRKEEKVLIPCGIPYIIGTVKSPEKNLISDTVLSNNNIQLIIDEVTSINKGAKTVMTIGGKDIKYEKMILAIGSSPIVPSLPGIELNNIFAVKKEVAYLQNLLKALDEARDVVIIGGGFIGLEFADECRKRGNLNVTVIELLPHCLLLACDEEICIQVEKRLSEGGINILADRRAKSFIGDEKVQYVELENGQRIFGTMIGDFAIGSAGMTERQAKEAGFNVVTGEAKAPDKHPASIPGTRELGVKLIFEKETGILLGGQAWGSVTAGLIANFIGALIQKRMRADEIVVFQVGTHPMLTASPIAHQIQNAAEVALARMK